MGFSWKVSLDKNSRLESRVSERLTGLVCCHLPMRHCPQRIVRHFPQRPSAVRPFVVSKAFQRLPSGMDQASFAGFAEADANRTIKANLFHGVVELRSRPDVPHMVRIVSASVFFQQHFGLAGGLDERSPGVVAGTQTVGRLNASQP